MIKTLRSWYLFLGALVLLAGCGPIVNTTPDGQIEFTETSLITQELVMDEVVEATIGPNFVTDSASLIYDPAVCSEMQAETYGEVSENADTAFWQIHPSHTAITCTLAGDSQAKGVIAVYPIARFKELSKSTAGQIDELLRILAERPDLGSLDDLPFFPIPNAEQTFHAREEYLVLPNTSGIRYLTQHSQGFTAVANDNLYYTFQGISSDGKFLISVQFPVRHPILPDEGLVPTEDMQAFVDEYLEYLSSIKVGLDEQPLESFIPDLNLLDEMLQTLVIKSQG